jgi:major membrane immunogen (membrane-anchored lipoprotein)
VKKTYLTLLVLPVFLFFACAQNGLSMKDGYYTAESAEFDDHGWKEYVTIYVSSGRIVTVEYNAFNASGFIKSWDMEYMRTMNAINKTYPNAYTRFYAGQLLNLQGTDGIDCLTGATNSYNSFLQLANAAIENAKAGIKEIRMLHIAKQGEDAGILHAE